MKISPFTFRPKEALSPAIVTGFVIMILSGLLFFSSPVLAAIFLGGFVLLCFSAPFFPQAGFFLPVNSRGKTTAKAVSLTFDDGPDPEATPRLLDLLDRHRAPATFFIVGEKAEEYRTVIHEILMRGHTVGNHSYHHDPLLMLRTQGRLKNEIDRTQRLLHTFGLRPLAFRPPVGITNPRLPRVLRDLDLYCVTFSCRAFDRGNRSIEGLAAKILKKVHPGAIIILHDVKPAGKGTIYLWLEEIERILSGLKSRGYEIIPLEAMIGRPVMERLQVKNRMP